MSVTIATMLRRQTRDCVEMAEQTDDDRARRLLTSAAEVLRQAEELAATAWRSDVSYQDRHLDLLDELGRRVKTMVRSAVGGRLLGRWSVEQRWSWAEDLVARMPQVLERARAASVDTAVRVRSHRESLRRLAAAADAIETAADEVRRAIGPAMAVPYAHPDVITVGGLAEEIRVRIHAVREASA
jgi:hypothetical protein